MDSFLTPLENAELAASQETVEKTFSRPESSRAWVALMLAPTPEIWEGLMLGEPVRADQLDPTWLKELRKLGVVE